MCCRGRGWAPVSPSNPRWKANGQNISTTGANTHAARRIHTCNEQKARTQCLFDAQCNTQIVAVGWLSGHQTNQNKWRCSLILGFHNFIVFFYCSCLYCASVPLFVSGAPGPFDGLWSPQLKHCFCQPYLTWRWETPNKDDFRLVWWSRQRFYAFWLKRRSLPRTDLSVNPVILCLHLN